MSLSRQEEFPESTLADDDDDDNSPPFTTVQGKSRYRDRVQSRGTPQRRSGRGGGPGQRFGSSGYTSLHLQQNWERDRVDIDRGVMVSIGRANSGTARRWNQNSQRQQRNYGSGGNSRQYWDNQGGRTGIITPRRQETPFVQGEMVLKPKQSTEQKEEEEQETKFVMDKGNYLFDPYKVPVESNPHQLRPSSAMYSLAQTLFKKDVKDWEMNDLSTPGSSDGTSILISAFVDYAASTLKTDMTMSQQFSLARIAIGTAPSQLLEYIKDPWKAMHFLEWALTKRVKIPPMLESLLCPIDMPNLITDEKIKEKIEDGNLPLEEQAIVIEVFVRCYYPKHASMIMETISAFSQETLKGYIEIPGKIEREMRKMNKPMCFSPPKWYRLSLHPETVIHATPRQPKEEKKETKVALQISVPDVALKLKMEADELVKLPPQKIRTAILTAIPMIFEDRISREGCTETFKYFENASLEEIIAFLGGKANMSNTEEKEEIKCAQLFRYLVRFEHTDKKEGSWTNSAVEILRKWINSIHPILRNKGESLVLSSHLFAPRTVNRLILTTPYELDEKELRKHTVVKRNQEGLTQFEVWIKSSCKHLKEITKGTGALEINYDSVLSDGKIIVKYRSRMPDNLVPAVMIKGSIETAVDAMIEEELFDRLVSAGIEDDVIPEYHVESVELNTTDGRHSGKMKCVVTARQDLDRLQGMIARITTPATRSKYLVTGDYVYKAIGYPPTENTDKEIAETLRDQRAFNTSSVRTSIYGLTGIDPYRDVPQYTKDLCTREKSENTGKSVAYFLLMMKMLDREGRMIRSPVTRVSTNPSGTKLYLHAPRTEAAELVRFTEEVMHLLHIWYENNNFHLKGDMAEAVYLTRAKKSLTQMEIQAINSGAQQINGDISEAQRKLDMSRTRDELVKTAKEGIEGNFTGGTETPAPAVIQKLDQEEDLQQMRVSKIESYGKERNEKIWNEIKLVTDGQKVQATKIAELTDMVQTALERSSDGMVTKTLMTISNLIETSSQSSISSITEVATAVRSHVDEHTKQTQSLISKYANELLVMCRTIPAIDNRIEELRILVTRQEQAAEKAAEAAKKTDEQQALIIKMLVTQQEYLRRLTESNTDTSVDFGHSDGAHERLEEDTTYQMQNTTYTEEVREKARHILSLATTMPYTKAQDRAVEEEGHLLNRKEMPNEATASLGVCKACGKKDYSLLYCDKCEGTLHLYHAGCMTFVEGLAEYHCNDCYGAELEGQRNENGDMKMTTTIHGSEGNESIYGSANDKEGEREEENIMDQSEMSISTSTSSSSSSSVGTYSPQGKRNTPRAKTLPSLKETEQIDTAKQATQNEISPLQTRAQRAARRNPEKTREDAFDTSEEEDENNPK